MKCTLPGVVYSHVIQVIINAVTFRRESLFSYSRVAIMILLIGSLATCIGSGLGIYNGLFHSTVTTQSFDLFIYIIGAMILLLTGFSPESTDLLLSVAPLGVLNAGVCVNSKKTNSTAVLANRSYRPAALALEYTQNQAPVTSKEINSLLLNQGVSISDPELKKLLSIPYVEFKLPFNSESYLAYTALVGRPNSRGRHVGVYVFTHIATEQMYVGSSNALGRRLNQYFDQVHLFTNKNSGLFMPLLEKDGIAGFTLKVYVMPAELSSGFYFLLLEQYFLLDPKFNLNTQRIVNFRVTQANSLHIYNEDLSILYHTSNSMSALKKEIGIHHSNIQSCLLAPASTDKEGELYLGVFRITTELHIGATKSDLSLQEFNNLLDSKRREALLKNRAKPIYIYNEDSTILYISAISFNAIYKDLGLCHHTACKLIDTGLLYHGCFILTSEFKPEARQSSMSTSELKDLMKAKRQEAQRINLKEYAGAGKKGISIQSEITGEVVVFPSYTAAFDYLRSKGVNMASRTLYKYLESGKVYKGYTFKKV